MMNLSRSSIPNEWSARITNRRGMTLIELLIAISIAAIMTATITFSLNSAFESWAYTRDQLSLHKVLADTMDRLMNGYVGNAGLWHALEVTEAKTESIEFLPPWIDDNHSVGTPEQTYTLNRKIKAGSGVPIAEVRVRGSEEWKTMPIRVVAPEDDDESASRVQISSRTPPGSDLRFIFRPEPEPGMDVLSKMWWDEEEEHVFLEGVRGIEMLTRNPFGVRVSKLEFRFFNITNHLIETTRWVDNAVLPLISGVEIIIEGRLGQYEQKLVSFVALRNSPSKSGYIPLIEGMEIPIPDSKRIHALRLENFTGIGDGDEIVLEAKPSSGTRWTFRMEFLREKGHPPVIASYAIEYPPSSTVLQAFPKMSPEAGINLMILGGSGFYDYDDDPDIDDSVLLEEPVILHVKTLDIKGAQLVVRP